MALLYLASAISDLNAPLVVSDKLLHLAAYTVLGLLLLRAFHGGMPAELRVLPTMLAVVVAVIYGGLDEIHQGFVAGRNSDPADFTADIGGALLAVVVLAVLVRLFRGKR